MWAFTGVGGGYVEQAIAPVEEVLEAAARTVGFQDARMLRRLRAREPA